VKGSARRVETSSGAAARDSSAATVTRLLNEAAGAGGERAAEALLPLVYDQLRRLAASKMRQQRPEHTLGATALVHEAYLRLVDESGVRQWESRRHFFAAAAEAMRWILIDNARHKTRLKRGGEAAATGSRQRVSLDEMQATLGEPPEDLLALDEALTALAQAHPDKAELVKLRYFAGLTIDEAARTLGISTATAERRWAFSRAWLFKRINGKQGS
jgi:RNA polymerase sigma factor (TIGR02999 family)